jgi:hypothetical protein
MRIRHNHESPIFTQREIAQRWKVSLATVRRRCKAGDLKVVRISPRRIGILPSEEQRYLKEREGR